MKLVTLIALLGGVEALTKWTDQIYDSTMGCAQCIATGNWFCKERGWYQTINASTGTVN